MPLIVVMLLAVQASPRRYNGTPELTFGRTLIVPPVAGSMIVVAEMSTGGAVWAWKLVSVDQ